MPSWYEDYDIIYTKKLTSKSFNNKRLFCGIEEESIGVRFQKRNKNLFMNPANSKIIPYMDPMNNYSILSTYTPNI